MDTVLKDSYEISVWKDTWVPVSLTTNITLGHDGCKIGDINQDNIINVTDNILLSRFLADPIQYSLITIQQASADITHDGIINTDDSTWLTRYLAEWDGYETFDYEYVNYIELSLVEHQYVDNITSNTNLDLIWKYYQDNIYFLFSNTAINSNAIITVAYNGSINGYWSEERICTIGSNERTDWSQVFNPVLKCDMYGQEIFTFDLYSQYLEDGKQTTNPYLDFLTNESKIKVKFLNKWHDFIVKGCDNSLSNTQILQYTCQSLAMYELGKSGYDITLSEDTNNNLLTVQDFMDIALDGTDWQISINSDDPQFLLENCLEWAYQLSYEGTIQGYKVTYNWENGRYQRNIADTPTSLTNGLIYIPYSEREKTSKIITFVESEDENDVEYDRYSFAITNGTEYQISSAAQGILSKFKINNHIATKETVYNSTYEGYVDIYRNSDNNVYYGFSEYVEAPYLKIYNKQYLAYSSGNKASIGIIVMDSSKYYKYKYEYKKSTTSSWTTAVATTTKAAYNFLDLDTGTTYNFRVTGYYKDAGGTEQSEELTLTATTYSTNNDSNLMTTDEISAYEIALASHYQTFYSPNIDLSDRTTTCPTGYSLSYLYEKVRTLNTQESNRFNITQDICELFEIWCRYEIEHDETTGAILYDSTNARYKKNVVLTDQYGQETQIGFVYGKNLKKITRNIKSDEIVTKLYVKDIEDDTLDNGYCSITNSEYNISKEDFLINFDYFISKGFLDETTTNSAISTYYASLRQKNQDLNGYFETLNNTTNGLTLQKATLEGNQIYYESERDAALESMATLEAKGKTAGDEEYDEQSTRHANAVASLINITNQLTTVNNAIKTCNTNINTKNSEITTLNNNFYKRYSRFIQEGTWQGEAYRDDNTYYSDAQKVLTDNGYPKIEYSLDIIDIHNLIDLETSNEDTTWEYSPYGFSVGDISTIQDSQYFDGKEQVVVSEVTYYFNEPEKNSITIQNYTTQFEDLFSKLNATVTSYDLNKNTYSKAENFSGTGALTFKSLQQSFAENKDLAYSNTLSTLEYDSAGIRIASIDKQNLVRLTSGGITLSSDGGETWQTGIYDGKINTKLLSAGQINAEEINILLGENNRYPNFVWNGYGLNAYDWIQVGTSTTYNYNKKVVFNKLGIYGFNSSTGRDINDDDGVTASNIMSNNDVWFALTWDGLKIKLPNTGVTNTIINVNDKFKVFGDGSILATDGEFTGKVTATSGSISGTLISGKIESGTIEVTQLLVNGTSISASNQMDSDYISDFSADKITSGTIDADLIDAGSITADKIKLYGQLTVYTAEAARSIGGYLGYCAGISNTGIGVMNSANTGQCICTNAGARLSYGDSTQVTCGSSTVYLEADSGSHIDFAIGGDTVALIGASSLRPDSDGGLDLGISTFKWGDTYCTNGAWTGSDRNLKTDINYDINTDAFFDTLKPVSYKWINNSHNRTHYGFIAQDVENSIKEMGWTTQDFAGFGQSAVPDENGNYTQFLRYSEFISLCVEQIQKLKKRINILEKKE